MKHIRFLNMLVAILLALALIGFPSSQASARGALVVTMANEGSDANPGDGFCALKVGGCTLRAAIEEANARAGADNIIFSLPGAGIHSISITSGPPARHYGHAQPGWDIPAKLHGSLHCAKL